jgi:hypothetical protein
LLFSINSFGQKTKVYGTVTDAQTGEILPFVNVMFQGSKIGTTTDLDGQYEIESYYATDSLSASFVGYRRLSIVIKKDISQQVDFKLSEASTDLPELIVIPNEINPAHPILKQVIANKHINNREKLESYEYEVYNKMEFDINNLSNKFQKSKVFKKFDFIFDNINSTEDKPYLPILISESLSQYHYRKNPKSQKEIIKATRVSGIDNESVSQFAGDMYQQINVYENHLKLLGRDFISPIANYGLSYYKYYLMDSMNIDGYWCYQLKYMPKRRGELTLDGTIWIHDTTYAVKKIEGDMAKDANLNLVEELSFTQTFQQVEEEVWMLTKDELFISFALTKNKTGFYGRKATHYSDFVINKPKPDQFYKGLDNIIVEDSAQLKSKEYWTEHRHDTLTEKEQGIYDMVDTLNDLPIIRSYTDIIKTIASGYKIMGKFELGPIYSLYSWNPVEGHRFSMGGRTSNDFSKSIEISGYAAYALLDEEFKYGGGTRFFITKEPRRLVKLVYKHDVEQVGISSNSFNSANAVTSIARRNPLNKLVFNTEYRASFEREWTAGLQSALMLRNASISPLGITPFIKTNPETSTQDSIKNITTSEVSLLIRYAHHEKHVSGEFDRVSLGTKHPTLSVFYTYGIPNVFYSEYEYHKLVFEYKHKFSLGIIGTTKYQFSLGKVWGDLPYPLLELHPGNETWGYNEDTYNLMNINEFVSDEYISFNVHQHFGGLFLNKLPLLRKLKWREVLTFKGIYGRLDQKNINLMALADYTTTLKTKPYMELAAGIENIFSFLRVDAVWRLTYLNHEVDGIKVSPFGIRGKLQFEF